MLKRLLMNYKYKSYKYMKTKEIVSVLITVLLGFCWKRSTPNSDFFSNVKLL